MRQRSNHPPVPSPPARGAVLQRKCACGQHTGGGECEECRKKRKDREPSLQKKGQVGKSEVSGDPEEIRKHLGAGSPFAGGARTRMESAFQRDFSRVRLHTDATAAGLSRDLHARAFTIGEHVAFAGGEFKPGTPLGDGLLAHELAHVAQQERGGAAMAPLEMGSPQYDSLEEDADRSAMSALSSLWGDARDKMGTIRDNAMPALRSGLALQRCSPDDEETAKEKAAEATKGAAEQVADSGTPGKAAASKDQAPSPPVPGASTAFELAGKERKKWRVGYDKKKAAQRWVDLLKKLRIKAEEPVQEGKLWTFYYFPLSKEEAEAEQQKKIKELGKKYDVKVEYHKDARTYYLKVSLKCPEAMPAKSGFDIWEKCFPSASKANELKRKFDKANIEAEVHQLDEDVYGLYYKPLKTEAEAKAAGKAAVSKRPGAAEGMYDIKAVKDEALKSYKFSVTTTCPKGYKDLGNFLCTSYFLAQEAEFAEKPTLKDPCGLKGTFRQAFLFGSGVKMQGSGQSMSGDIIHYTPKKDGTDCFEKVDCPKTAIGTCATSGQTVAVDPKVIPLRSKLLIEDVGPRVAEDTGGRIKGKHLDVYHGTDLTRAQAMNNTLKDKKVCQKT